LEKLIKQLIILKNHWYKLIEYGRKNRKKKEIILIAVLNILRISFAVGKQTLFGAVLDLVTILARKDNRICPT